MCLSSVCPKYCTEVMFFFGGGGFAAGGGGVLFIIRVAGVEVAGIS